MIAALVLFHIPHHYNKKADRKAGGSSVCILILSGFYDRMIRLDDTSRQRILRILPRFILKPVIKLVDKPANVTIHPLHTIKICLVQNLLKFCIRILRKLHTALVV